MHERALLVIDPGRARALKDAGPRQEAAERIGGALKALADPTRLRLAAALSRTDELCVCDLAEIVDKPQNLTSHHLQILRGRELVTSRRAGKMVMYRLTGRGAALVEAALAGGS